MITLYTGVSPNGWKVSILLEELGLEYKVHFFDLSKGEHLVDWYTEINPNSKVPAIIDHDNGDFKVFESGAILVYLAEKYGKFMPSDPKKRSEAMQWLFFQMSSVGPTVPLAQLFGITLPEKSPVAIEYFHKEARRLMEVLDKRLEGRDYIVDEYSIVDIATFTWLFIHPMVGLSSQGLDNLNAWLARIAERQAVKKGLDVPIPLAELMKK